MLAEASTDRTVTPLTHFNKKRMAVSFLIKPYFESELSGFFFANASISGLRTSDTSAAMVFSCW
jgi:hypothetical protein